VRSGRKTRQVDASGKKSRDAAGETASSPTLGSMEEPALDSAKAVA